MLDLSFIQPQNTRGTAANGSKGAEKNSEEADTTDFAAEYDEADDAIAVSAGVSADTEIDPQLIAEDESKPNKASEETTARAATDYAPTEATDEIKENEKESGGIPLFTAADTTSAAKLPPAEAARSKEAQHSVLAQNSKRYNQPSAEPSLKVNESGQSTKTTNNVDETLAAQSEVAKRTTAETVVLTRALQAKNNPVEDAPQMSQRVETKVAPAGAPSQVPARTITSQQIPEPAQKSEEVRVAPQLTAQTREPRNSRSSERHLDGTDLQQQRKPTTLAPPLPIVAAPQNVQSRMTTHLGPREGLDNIVSELDILQSFDQRTAQQTASTQLQHVLQRSETPAMIARQMAEALQKLPDKPVEISLNPKELGRVRMNISAAEAGITVNVMAERPETLDLMRRHIDQLTREFQVIGYNDINFAFSQDQTQQGFADDGDEANRAMVSHIEVEHREDTTKAPPSAVPTSGVDIRV